MRQFIQTVVGKLFYWLIWLFTCALVFRGVVWLCSNTLENWIESTALLNGLVLLSVVILCPLTVRGSLGSGAVCWPQPSSAGRPNHCIKRVALSKSCAIISPGIGNGSFYGPALPISYN